MKKYASLMLVVATHFCYVSSVMGCHIPPSPPSCPECPPGSTLINIDFDDFLAGTLVGGYSNLQRYTSANNDALAASLGFTIDIGNNNGPVINCKEVEVGALYDTDRREYYTNNPWDGGTTTTWYNDTSVTNRNDTYIGRGSSGQDTDLEVTNYYSSTGEDSKWAGGNMQYYNLGNALIIQEHVDGDDVSQGHLDRVQGLGNPGNWEFAPDDDADGGFITFEFESAMNGFGFTFADLDCSEVYSTNITFFDTTGESVQVSFAEFINGGDFSNRGSANTSGTVVWGDNTANRIDTITVAELNQVMGTSLSNFSSVSFNLSGSGGITHINYCYSAVPEASTVMAGGMIVFLLGGFQVMRKRRKNQGL